MRSETKKQSVPHPGPEGISCCARETSSPQPEGEGKRIETILLFANGMMAVCDERGAQIPELQVAWFVLFAERAVKLGYDPHGTIVETLGGQFRLLRTSSGWNLEPRREPHEI